MKILITTFTYPPNADGVAEATAALANGLAGLGHEVTVATEYHAGRLPNRPDSNPKVEQFKLSGIGRLGFGIKGDPREYQEFLRNFQCDVLVCEAWHVWSTHLALPLLKEIKAKKVLVSHGYTAHLWVRAPRFAWGLGQWIKGWPEVLVMPLVMRQFDHVVFLSARPDSDRMIDLFVAKRIGLKNCSVIPNGAYVKEFAESSVDFRAKQGILPGPLLLCVANYGDRKNQAMALRAFRHAQIKNGTLVFIGSEFNEYSVQLKQLDLSLQADFPAGRVLLLEKVCRDMTCAAFRAADLFVLSAKAETQPIVLLEAMASRTPFLSTNVGRIAELPGGVAVRDEAEMAAKMRELIDQPSLREELASRGWEACRNTYDWERVVEAYDRLLSGLVRGGDSR